MKWPKDKFREAGFVPFKVYQKLIIATFILGIILGTMTGYIVRSTLTLMGY